MKNIFIIHSLNGDTIDFWGQDIKQSFEKKLNVFMPKFPIRADSSYENFDKILTMYFAYRTKKVNKTVCESCFIFLP